MTGTLHFTQKVELIVVKKDYQELNLMNGLMN
jgi:hypothetical protein